MLCNLPQTITLSYAESEDEPFLFQLYSSAREEEIAVWEWNEQQRHSFLKMQYESRKRSYSWQYPQQEHWVIICEGQKAGALMLNRKKEIWTLVDISLLPSFRSKGIGAKVISDLLQEAAKEHVPVRLSILKTNPAHRLYFKLGFQNITENEIYIQMEWRHQEKIM